MHPLPIIDTDRLSTALRERVVDLSGRRLVPPNSLVSVQVFQNAACNWRCWYCYVPFRMLAGREDESVWLSAPELVQLYLAEPERCLIIDCSGGQPDLTPEWILWMMEALVEAGIDESIYLWSDDNLSNDYFWRYLSPDDRHRVARYRNYGRGCCFKGFDRTSFHFNTRADPSLFDQQFDLLDRLIRQGLDVYAYATFTTPDARAIVGHISDFIDRLQQIHELMPLRLIPLRIRAYGVVRPRMDELHYAALQAQEEAVLAWNAELEQRFNATTRAMPITAVALTDGSPAPRPAPVAR